MRTDRQARIASEKFLLPSFSPPPPFPIFSPVIPAKAGIHKPANTLAARNQAPSSTTPSARKLGWRSPSHFMGCIGLRLAEMRHPLSRSLANLITFGWETHGEPQAALRFWGTRKDVGKPRAFQAAKLVSWQTRHC